MPQAGKFNDFQVSISADLAHIWFRDKMPVSLWSFLIATQSESLYPCISLRIEFTDDCNLSCKMHLGSSSSILSLNYSGIANLMWLSIRASKAFFWCMVVHWYCYNIKSNCFNAGKMTSKCFFTSFEVTLMMGANEMMSWNFDVIDFIMIQSKVLEALSPWKP